MLWIFRRTGAANFFTSINNNYSSKSNTSKNISHERNQQRPPRKAYGRLSIGDPDENCNTSVVTSNGVKSQAYMNPFDELDNFETTECTADSELNENCVQQSASNGNEFHTMITKSIDQNVSNNVINRLQAMAISDDDDIDESLTCNVCDRSFSCCKQLTSHQQKKRHFGCNGCDILFSSLMQLEHHKEEFEHWSDDDDYPVRPSCCRRAHDDDFTDSDSFMSDAESEDLERLL